MATIDLTGVVTSLGTIFGNTSSTTAASAMTTIAQNVALGAVSAALLKGLQHPDVQSALNPLGLSIPGLTPAATTPAATAPVAAATPVAAKTIAASVFAALPAASQTLLLSEGYSIVAG